MFFKNKILENLHEIQNKIKEESEVVEKLKRDILSLQNDIDERKKLKSTFECDLCSKVFKREAFMERHMIKVHTNVIP